MLSRIIKFYPCLLNTNYTFAFAKFFTMPELSRTDKQTARTIIDKGLDKEIEKSIQELEQLIGDCKEKKIPLQEAWRQLYHSIKKNDKHISARYDGLSGSRYDAVLAAQLKEGVITTADLDGLEEEIKSTIIRWSSID